MQGKAKYRMLNAVGAQGNTEMPTTKCRWNTKCQMLNAIVVQENTEIPTTKCC